MPEARRSAPSGPAISRSGQVTVDFTSCGSAAVTVQTVSIPNTEPGDTIILTPPAGGFQAGLGILPGYCSAVGVAKIPVVNPTSGAIDAASTVFDYQIIKSAHVP